MVRRRRRHSNEQDAGPLVVGEIEIRPDQFRTFIAGQSLDLTRREFRLIQLLAHNEGKVLDRESIYQRVWGYAMAHGDRSVDVFIRKLRTKLERRSPAYTYIHTHFGVGYRFAAGIVDCGRRGDRQVSSGPPMMRALRRPACRSALHLLSLTKRAPDQG